MTYKSEYFMAMIFNLFLYFRFLICRPALNSHVKILVGSLIQTFVAKAQTAKWKTTNQFARVQEVY